MVRLDRSAKKVLLCSGLMAAALGLTSPASAQAPDYTGLFKTKVLKCLHPTVSVDTATYETVKGPETKGEISTVRLKVFYAGLVKKNALEADLMVRQAGSIRQFMVNVLSDTGTGVARCAMTTTWTDF